MAALEQIKPGALIDGIVPDIPVEVVAAQWVGSNTLTVVFRNRDAGIAERTLFRDDEIRLSIASAGRNWSFEADGDLLRLVTEATRIQLAHHFDPYLAIHTSRVMPLPHQISAVYGEMLPRQPLRFLLADDPGAGKTIMAGLLIRELAARSDLDRCLVVAPGSLVEQWQDELGDKFGLDFEILTRDMIEASRSGNVFTEKHRLIARLDVLSRNEDLQQKLLDAGEWDLIIGDEAHRMSATWFASEVKYTKRYQLGQLLGKVCRHYLLMSATPHNGKEADFQLFMALLDGDRFEGRPRDGVHSANVGDMMRRLTKEELRRFDGRPLFPERRAYTIKYDLSPQEVLLYDAVTEYVREEMNRVARFSETDGRRKNNVGFALQILQRRLASSPAAIHQSLKRRRERLEAELAEVTLQGRAQGLREGWKDIIPGDFEEMEEYDPTERDLVEDTLSASATSAENAEQLRIEIATLQELEAQAFEVLKSGEDAKWTQLDRILDDDLMRDPDGNRRKLIVFTEPKDTLLYLRDRITNRLGREDAVAVIHGGVTREERRRIVERFMTDKDLLVLIANDAAGEGVNLQRGHLMVNYDLPWNPTRIEQRFGRIHRIGQTEVCHLWNLVAHETREGEVYARLLDKLETARVALGGRVYDVLGELFEGVALRDLLFEAIQYGERAEVKSRLFEAVDGAVDNSRLIDLLRKRALTNDSLPEARVEEIRLERADAQRLQPHLSLSDVWEYCNRFTYLPRLRDKDVLKGAVIKSVSALTPGPFAYAETVGEDGRYEGLLIEQDTSRAVIIDSQSVILKADVAKAQKEKDEERASPAPQPEDAGVGGAVITGPGGPDPDSGQSSPPPEPAPEALPTSFYGAVELSADRPARDMAKILDGIIEQIVNMPGGQVTLRLEIDGEVPGGFDKNKQRTLLENAQTLEFKDKRLS